MRAPIEARFVDTHIGFWQDNAKDPSFRTDVYGGLIRLLRQRGWTISADPDVHRHHRCISPDHRLGRRGALRCSIQVCGRHVEVNVWAETWPVCNRNGQRYDFGKLDRFDYLDRQRFILERRYIVAWLRTIAPVSVFEPARRMSALERIRHGYDTSWHTKTELGRPDWGQNCNRTSGDGALLEHDQDVWVRSDTGRWLRGRAFYNLNSMWWVVAGGELHNKSCGELFVARPSDLREKLNRRRRRARLEGELAKAIVERRYQRAELLDRILFASADVFNIWSRKNDCWYGVNFCGYTKDRNRAGRYTRDEAEREVRRVPHILEAHGPGGLVFRIEAAA